MSTLLLRDDALDPQGVLMASLPPREKPRPAFVPAGREYVSLAEIAHWTGLHITTVRRHQAKGALRTVKVGGKVLVRVDVLAAYLDA